MIVAMAGLAIGLVAAFFPATTTHGHADSPWDTPKHGHSVVVSAVVSPDAQSPAGNPSDSPWD